VVVGECGSAQHCIMQRGVDRSSHAGLVQALSVHAKDGKK